MFSNSLIQPLDDPSYLKKNLSFSILKSRKVNLSSAFNNLESSDHCSRVDFDPETQTQWINVQAPPKEELSILSRKLSLLSGNNSSKTLSNLRPITQFGTPTSNSQPYLQFSTSSRPITGTSTVQDSRASNPTLYTNPGTSYKNLRIGDSGLNSQSNFRLTRSRNSSVNNFRLSNADTVDSNHRLSFHHRRLSAPKNIETSTSTSQFYLSKPIQSPKEAFAPSLTVKRLARNGRSKDFKGTEVDQSQTQGVKVVHSFRRLPSTSAKRQELLSPKVNKPRPVMKGKTLVTKERLRVSKITHHGNIPTYKLSQLLDLKPKEPKAHP